MLPVHGISMIFAVMSSLEYGFRFSFVFLSSMCSPFKRFCRICSNPRQRGKIGRSYSFWNWAMHWCAWRFLAVIRLHRIILDVTNPSFHVEERQWRSSVIEVFYRYFSALWVDDKVTIQETSTIWTIAYRLNTGRNSASGWVRVAKSTPCPFRSYFTVLEWVVGKGADCRACEAAILPCTASFPFSDLER